MKSIPDRPRSDRTAPDSGAFRLVPAEREQLARDGYILRTGVFNAAEVDAIAGASEALVDDVVRNRHGHRLEAGSYVFEPDLLRHVIIKWEGDSDVVHGIEPCAHLSPGLETCALDPRFVEPMQHFVGHDAPALFTEKLNLKRAGIGGVNPLHQDHPYWVGVAAEPARVATAMLFLDNATLDNACLRVVPGSHRQGEWQRRTDGSAFLGNEIDGAAYADVESVPIECAAGSVVMFGAFLVHHSEPNRSGRQRRALLFSYQPPGHPHMLDALRKLASPPS